MSTIGIVTGEAPGALPWDPESIHTGISGSEEAIIYMGLELVKLGHRVIVFARPPEASRHTHPSSNPLYVPRETLAAYPLDIAISWRMEWIAPLLRPHAKRVYLWPHDICQKSLPAAHIEGFDDVLWLSRWQREQWCAMNPGFARFPSLFGNGIVPLNTTPSSRENPYSCIYGSNYGAGLELLLALWPQIKELYPRATLDIYYGWSHWGLLTPQAERNLRHALAVLAPLGCTEHGRVGHAELTQAYGRASFWTYPCRVSEVFCISALRAQLAGALPVIISPPNSALGETVRYGYACRSPNDYFATLQRAMRDAESIDLAARQSMGAFVRQEYSWEAVALRWQELFAR